ncbi:hypothetical protein HQ585_11895 [candidate division KSB1 bacterium]|nr:hypothetical protein [candidate division KSB1 bacterium]
MKKVFLIILLVVGVIVLAVVIFIAVNKEKMMNTVMEKSIEMFAPVVAESVPEGIDADSVKIAFEGALNAIKSGAVDQEKKKDLLITFQTCMADKQLDSAEVVMILDKLDGLQAVPE